MSGILGIFGHGNQKAYPYLYYGLYALQHRGQGAVGLGTIDEEGAITLHRKPGLISDSFGQDLISDMPGNKGLGFVQYSFEDQETACMPIQYKDGLLAIDGFVNNPDFDANKCVDALHGSIQEIQTYLESLTGKFALVFMACDRFIVYKNHDGIKPLSIGKNEMGMIAASETTAIDAVGGTVIREIQPGELFYHSEDQSFSFYLHNSVEATENLDAFEFIYTARPDSVLDGISIYQARYRMGQNLWQEDRETEGIVIGAPDSGIISSLGYAHASGLPYQQGFFRNRYIGRTFIQSSDLTRRQSLKIKLTPIKANVMNQTIILVDDSIVRGSTILKTVKSLKEAGAKEVHVRIASPPIVNSESVTVDIPDQKKLIAYNRTVDEVREIIGCDSLRYLSLNAFHQAIGINTLYEPYFGV